MPIYVRTKTDALIIRHWAIFTFSSITIPGDERSRTNPGHGYPEHREPVVTYVAYTDKAAWEEQIKQLELQSPKSNFAAAEINPAVIETAIVIKTGPPEGPTYRSGISWLNIDNTAL